MSTPFSADLPQEIAEAVIVVGPLRLQVALEADGVEPAAGVLQAVDQTEQAGPIAAPVSVHCSQWASFSTRRQPGIRAAAR